MKQRKQRKQRTHGTQPYIAGGRGAVRPYLYVRPDSIDFTIAVFGAEILVRHDMPTGSHVEMAIGDSVLVLEAAESFPDHAPVTVASVYVYVPDVDDVYARAMAAGAQSISPPEDKHYDERQCGFKDSAGNVWWVSTHADALG